MTAWHGSPEPWTGAAQPLRAPSLRPGRSPGRRTGRRDRVSPESVFAELLSLAAIPHAAYAVDQEVPGAMCLVKADGGFEVFSRTDDARLEVQFFQDEEAAYFYLFGVLAAEAVRSGRLAPNGPGRSQRPAHRVPARQGKRFEVLTGRETYPPPRAVRLGFVLPAGLTVPRSPSSPVGLRKPAHIGTFIAAYHESVSSVLSFINLRCGQ